jgi:hypothetical protein
MGVSGGGPSLLRFLFALGSERTELERFSHTDGLGQGCRNAYRNQKFHWHGRSALWTPDAMRAEDGGVQHDPRVFYVFRRLSGESIVPDSSLQWTLDQPQFLPQVSRETGL